MDIVNSSAYFTSLFLLHRGQLPDTQARGVYGKASDANSPLVAIFLGFEMRRGLIFWQIFDWLFWRFAPQHPLLFALGTFVFLGLDAWFLWWWIDSTD